MTEAMRQAAAEVVREEIDPAEADAIDALPLPYVEIDAHGIILRANRASIALNNMQCGELVGKMAWDLVAADEKETSFAAYCLSLEKGDAEPVVLRSIYDRSGQFRTYEFHRSLVRDGEGNPSGMRMVCVDVTDAKKALNDARRKSLWLESVIDSIGVAIVVTDAVGFICAANPAAEVLLGWKAAELQGMPMEAGVPVVEYLAGERTELPFTLVLESASRGMATVLDRSRRELKVWIETSPIFDKETGATAGAVLALREMDIPA